MRYVYTWLVSYPRNQKKWKDFRSAPPSRYLPRAVWNLRIIVCVSCSSAALSLSICFCKTKRKDPSSLNSYHHLPLFGGLGSLVESAPLRIPVFSNDWGDTHQGHLLYHLPHRRRRHKLRWQPPSFGPRPSYPPPQPHPVRSKRGVHYNHPQPASITASLMGQFQPGASTYHEGRKPH